jgi:hypothetical protein
MITKQANAVGWVCIACVLILMFFLDSRHYILYEFNLFVLLLVALSVLIVFLLRRTNLGGGKTAGTTHSNSLGDSNTSKQE